MQYLLEIKDEREIDFLLALLAKFDFVNVVPRESVEQGTAQIIEPANNQNLDVKGGDESFKNGTSGLLAAAGTLDREINAEELRKATWGRMK